MITNILFKLPARKLKILDLPIKRHRVVLFCLALFCQAVSGQICDKKVAIYFESNQSKIPDTENAKLQKLLGVFSQKTDTFMLEIDAFSESIASAEYNYKLANNRLKTIVSYLKKNAASYFEIKERVRGEALPLRSNATEEGRSKNRRVDIMYLKLKCGKISVRGKGGMEMEIEKNYFEPCGVCESNPKITEVFTNAEAESRGIPMTTTDGDELITAGMINLDSGCDIKLKKEANNSGPCRDVIIRIPAAQFDEDMELWKSTNDNKRSSLRWKQDNDGELSYDAVNKCYVLKVNYCPGKSMINLDKRKPRKIADKVLEDSTGLIAVPELNRANRGTYVKGVENVKILGRGREINSMWNFKYRGKGSLFFTDAGLGKNKIGYEYSGIIDKFEVDCDTVRGRRGSQFWCFEIPIDNYTKIIYYQKNKNYRLKVPGKYKNCEVRLYIPAADSLLPLTRVKGSTKKYSFKKPLPDTYVVVYGKNGNLKDKRGFDAQIDLADIKTKYNKRKGYYKAKIKRRQLKSVNLGA